MRTLIEAITAWPVILQGAIGSALFSLLLWAGQHSVRKGRAIFSKLSRERKIDRIQSELLRYTAFRKGMTSSDNTLVFVGLIYSALRELAKALVVICLGLMTDSLVPVLGVVGYVMALYFLFRAVDLLRDTEDRENRDAIVEKLKAELAALEEENPKVQSGAA